MTRYTSWEVKALTSVSFLDERDSIFVNKNSIPLEK
jgi:hypothetical protein